MSNCLIRERESRREEGRESERFIDVSIEQNRLRIFSARAHALLAIYVYNIEQVYDEKEKG